MGKESSEWRNQSFFERERIWYQKEEERINIAPRLVEKKKMTDKPIQMLVITQQKPSEIYIWSNCIQIKTIFMCLLVIRF